LILSPEVSLLFQAGFLMLLSEMQRACGNSSRQVRK
jgi:hypothetical protein